MKTFLRNWALKFGLMRRRKSVRGAAACLAVGLATAWSAPAEATVIHLEVSPTETLTEGWVVYYYYRNLSGYLGEGVFLGTLPGGQTTSFNHDFPDVELDDFGENHGFVIFGRHAEGDGLGMTASFVSDWPVIEGKTWSDIFSPQWPDEQVVVNNWPTYNKYDLNFHTAQFNEKVTVPYGTQATLISFSDPTLNGTAIASLVPEPATWVLVVSAVGGCALAGLRGANPKRTTTNFNHNGETDR